MAKYRIDNIAALARQMQFTPADTRSLQVQHAEDLLLAIDPAKAYPFEFVVYRITGYHPKTPVSQELLTGLALQHDVGLLIEQVSDSLDVQTRAISEPVLTIDDVSARFNVTSKTIQRWRRKGLPARRFLFPDGKRRVGFLLGSVERFLASHQDQVQRGTNFSQVDDGERDRMLRMARRLAGQCGCCSGEIARRIARKTGRSPMTVQHILRKHDEEHPDTAVFPSAGKPIGDDERARIIRWHRRGVSLRRIAQRICRSRSAIYRVLIQERVERLSHRKVKFFDDPLYHQPDAEAAINAIAEQEALPAPSQPEDRRTPNDLPPHLAALYREPLLSPARERGLFLKLNFHKMQFVSLRRKLDPQLARRRDIKRMEEAWGRAIETKNTILQANLRLVVSVARKHLRPGVSLAELLSEGSITMMRAIDGFDVHRGHKFSTYATLALMKGFARSVPQMMTSRTISAPADVLSSVADHRGASREGVVEHEALRGMIQRLNEQERTVVLGRFGLNEGAAATHAQIGRRLGLNQDLVQQIERIALAKLRLAAP